jgi:phosphomevalonate kinase
MTVKQKLESIRKIKAEIKSLDNELKEIKEISCKVINYDFAARTASVDGSCVERAAEKIERLQIKIMNKITEWAEAVTEAEELIDKLEDIVQKRILRSHYIDGKTFEKVAVEQYYCVRSVKLIASKAINYLELIKKTPAI